MATKKKAASNLVSIDDIKALPNNAKVHAEREMSNSVRAFGFIEPLVVNDETGHLISGHGRVDVLRQMRQAGDPPPEGVTVRGKQWLVPVHRARVDAAKEYAASVALNKLTELGGWNMDMLADALVRAPDLLGLTGFTLDDLPIIDAATDGVSSANDEPELPEEPTATVGDIFLLGEHRLACGDSRDVSLVRSLFGSDRAMLMMTDPPYGVDYAATKDGIPRSGFRTQRADWGDIAGDELKDVALQSFLESVFTVAKTHALHDRAAWYLWHAHLTQGFFAAAAAAAADVLLHRQIIWRKSHMVLTRSGMYHWRHEPCFFGWRRGKRPPWYGPKNQTSVWEIEYDKGERFHQAQKPVELFEIAMRNHTRKGDICFDPFAGAGPQIIAAERLGRRCFAVEIDPRYVDVCVKRWETFTGKVAEKLNAAGPSRAAGASAR